MVCVPVSMVQVQADLKVVGGAGPLIEVDEDPSLMSEVPLSATGEQLVGSQLQIRFTVCCMVLLLALGSRQLPCPAIDCGAIACGKCAG